MPEVGGWIDLINGVEEIDVSSLRGHGPNNELHEAESCRDQVCSLPETLELGARGNAEKDIGLVPGVCFW